MLKNKVKFYDYNTKGRDFVVGDIHGCYDELMTLLECVNFNKSTDIMYSTGDLIDRGKDSMKCLELIYTDWFKPVYSNHEQMFVETMLGGETYGMDSIKDTWIYNGGMWYVHEDKEYLRTIANDIVQQTPYIIVLGNDTDKRVNIVHAEIVKNFDGNFASDVDINGIHFHDYQIDDWLWGRHLTDNGFMYKRNKKNLFPHLSVTYCGHTPLTNPVQIFSHRFIDTGAVYGTIKDKDYKLTAVDLTNGLVYSLNTYTRQFETKPIEEVFPPKEYAFKE